MNEQTKWVAAISHVKVSRPATGYALEISTMWRNGRKLMISAPGMWAEYLARPRPSRAILESLRRSGSEVDMLVIQDDKTP